MTRPPRHATSPSSPSSERSRERERERESDRNDDVNEQDAQAFALPEDEPLFFSAITRQGRNELWAAVTAAVNGRRPPPLPHDPDFIAGFAYNVKRASGLDDQDEALEDEDALDSDSLEYRDGQLVPQTGEAPGASDDDPDRPLGDSDLFSDDFFISFDEPNVADER